MSKETNITFMRRAVELAFKGSGQTSPNPTVGAVIVKNGKIIAEGYHKGAGLPHAEINALRKAGKKANSADIYVTLEPCCHFGKTPPCTNAIIKAGIKRVFFGMKDPNPIVSGNGIKKLKKAGIKVFGPILEERCQSLNQPFIKWIKTGVPYITAKIAITLDGKIADAKGDSKWISNEKSRSYAHVLRSMNDIVMVGANTFKKDKPKLNVRLKGYKGKQPIPMVVSTRNLKKLVKELGLAGFQSILVEGGGKLQTNLLKNKLIDYIVVFITPKILGGKAKNWIGDIGISSIKKILNIRPDYIFTLGDDIVLEGKPNY